jgi:4-alpha-glucanotransferase
VSCRCIVIGEDLGTVPENFRETLADWGIWSYQVMLFERDADGNFQPPEKYRKAALATFSTHDLPTLAGWSTRHDLRVKRALHIDPGETDAERERAISALRRALAARGLRSVDFAAVAQFLAEARSRLVAVAVEDALGLQDQVNVPGTVEEHPNWRRRLPVLLDALRGRLAPAAAAMAAAGRNAAGRG